MPSCVATDLADSASCYVCLSDKQSAAIIIYLLTQIAGTTTDPNDLLALSVEFVRLSKKQQEAIMTYVLCQAATAVGA